MGVGLSLVQSAGGNPIYRLGGGVEFTLHSRPGRFEQRLRVHHLIQGSGDMTFQGRPLDASRQVSGVSYEMILKPKVQGGPYLAVGVGLNHVRLKHEQWTGSDENPVHIGRRLEVCNAETLSLGLGWRFAGSIECEVRMQDAVGCLGALSQLCSNWGKPTRHIDLFPSWNSLIVRHRF